MVRLRNYVQPKHNPVNKLVKPFNPNKILQNNLFIIQITYVLFNNRRSFTFVRKIPSYNENVPILIQNCCVISNQSMHTMYKAVSCLTIGNDMIRVLGHALVQKRYAWVAQSDP